MNVRPDTDSDRADYIARVIAAAPPLSDHVRDEIAQLLRVQPLTRAA